MRASRAVRMPVPCRGVASGRACAFNSANHIDVQVTLGRTDKQRQLAEPCWRCLLSAHRVALAVSFLGATATSLTQHVEGARDSRCRGKLT